MSIIKNDALYLALKEGWIADVGLDDIEEEPARQRDWKPVNPIFGLDNVIITPHAAYYCEEAIRTVRDFAAHEMTRVLTGLPPLSPVNAAQLAIIRPATRRELCQAVRYRGAPSSPQSSMAPRRVDGGLLLRFRVGNMPST